MAKLIYRGYGLESTRHGCRVSRDGQFIAEYVKESDAMDAVDKLKREERQRKANL